MFRVLGIYNFVSFAFSALTNEEVGGYENLLDKYSKAVPDPEFAAFHTVDGKNQVHNLLTFNPKGPGLLGGVFWEK
jgi:hypothetical protein